MASKVETLYRMATDPYANRGLRESAIEGLGERSKRDVNAFNALAKIANDPYMPGDLRDQAGDWLC